MSEGGCTIILEGGLEAAGTSLFQLIAKGATPLSTSAG